MVNFRDEVIDPCRESRVAGARQDLDSVILRRLRCVDGTVFRHYNGPVDCELLGREDIMEELEDCFCVMTSAYNGVTTSSWKRLVTCGSARAVQ